MKRKAIMIRFEGTLTNDNIRMSRLMSGQLANKNNYFTAYKNDPINEWCVDICNRFKNDHVIVFYSNHPNQLLEEIEDFIAEKTGLKFTEFRLFCVRKYEKRRAHVAFEQLYLTKISKKFEINFAIEQRLNACRIWRQQGIVAMHNTERQS